MPQILGILNLTRDSFSDGGAFVDAAGRLDAPAAIARGEQLVADGADIVDVGAESSHPDAADVSVAEEIGRLTPVVAALVARGVVVSVDTCKPAVMAHVLGLGARLINDITALRHEAAVATVRGTDARVVVMYSRTGAGRATREAASPGRTVVGAVDAAPDAWIERVVEFFRHRVVELEANGLERRRLILDPGMGFFLGDGPAPSLAVLRDLPRLKAVGLPICVSTSRKSFIGAVLGRGVRERGAGTLATELWAARSGADYIRTHDVRALRDALRMTAAIEAGV